MWISIDGKRERRMGIKRMRGAGEVIIRKKNRVENYEGKRLE
jgi:hypothetical protein